MILEIDWGNTRIKWRMRDESGRLAGGAAAALDELASNLPPGRAPERVWVASVRAPDEEAALSQWARERWALTPRFARTRAQQGGVVNGYRQPERLGVDRWLALLALRRESSRPQAVVQAGTALTADLLDGDGRHRGGYIAPGWQSMRRALAGSTALGLSAPHSGGPGLAPGLGTEEAIEAGLSALCRGLLGTVQDRLGESGRLVLSGGDAELLQVLCPRAELRSELVLDGLAVALEPEGESRSG